MKRVIFLVVLLAGLCLIHAEANTFSLTLGAGIRNVTGTTDETGDNLYEKVYGKNNLAFGIDLGYQVIKALQIFLHSDYFSVKGELTLTKDETTLTIIPLELGGRFFLGKKIIFPYIGAGIGYYMYKEENIIGTVNDKQFGFFTEGGFKLLFMKSLFFDLKLKYVFLKVDGAEGKVNLGGLAYMGGIGITF